VLRIFEKYTYFVHSVTLPVGLSSERVEVSEVLHGVDAVCIIELEFSQRVIYVIVRPGLKYLLTVIELHVFSARVSHYYKGLPCVMSQRCLGYRVQICEMLEDLQASKEEQIIIR